MELRSYRRAACVGVIVVCGGLLFGCSRSTRPSAGFWFEDGTVTLALDDTNRLGGPLRPEDIDEIEKIARVELLRAFSEFNIDITDGQNARWRVSVTTTIAVGGVLPPAGGSVQLGGLGGRGSVALATLATIAVRRAPHGASRREMLEGIGRGIGCAAAHELAHQVLGKAMREDKADIDSYEYFSADRTSQYFGRLHWAAARPLLQEKLPTG